MILAWSILFSAATIHAEGVVGIPVTAVSGTTVYVALPLRHGLADGAALRVLRDGREVGSAVLRLPPDQPPYIVSTQGERQPLRVGDLCYATAEAATPNAPGANQAPEPAAVLVSSVSGSRVYFWAASPDSLAASTERLSIIRDDRCIAVVRLAAEGPLGGTVESTAPGAILTPGDRARPWAASDQPQEATPREGAAAPTTPPQVAQAPVEAPVVADATPRATTPVTAPVASRPATSAPPDEPQSRWPSPPLGLSLSGPTGILRTPNAEVQPLGVLRIGRIHASPDLDRTFPGSRSRTQFTVGAFPRTEIGAAHFARFLEDITYHAKIQLVPETRRRPAVAIGTMDERAAFDLQPTRFVTLGKHFLDGRLRTTLGYGDGGLNGLFGGLEAAITPNLALLAEYDSAGANFGLRAAPTPRIHIDLADVDGHLAGQATYALVMGEREPAPGFVELPRPTEPVEPQALADRLQEAVCALGVENVRAEVGETPQGRTAVVLFENRRYLHDETEALGLVLAAAVRELPPDISRLGIIVTKYRVPVLRVVTNPDDYVRFLRGDLAPERYADMLEADRAGESPVKPSDRQAHTDLANPTRYTADIALTPLLRALIGTERPTPSDPENTQTLSLRVSLRPDIYADLGRGLSLRYSHGVHVAGGLAADVDPYYAEDAAHVSYLFRPLGGVLARVAAGDFLGGRRGGVVEGALGLQDDRLLIRGVAGRLSDHRFFGAGPYEWTYVGDIRYHVPALDMTAQATFGRYVDADAGFTLGLRKYLRDVELEVQYRDTDNGRVLLFGGTIPLGPRAWSPPDPIRLRLADRVSFSQRALIPASGDLGLVSTALLVGNQPQDFDLTDSLLNRDRLNATYLRDHLSTLLRAAGQVVHGD